MKIIDDFLRISREGNIKGALEFQKSLLALLRSRNRLKKFKSICAFDISYEKATRTNYATSVVMSYPELEVVEISSQIEQATFPYVPGLLAFREGPSVVDVFRKLKCQPDVLLFDGHGMAHPRAMGIACMIGILLDMPAIGCAKSLLVGDYDEPALTKGSTSSLFYKGKRTGNVLRTRDGVRPVFVSVGHLIRLDTATKVVLGCCRRYRLPEPIREAHRLANEMRKNHDRIKNYV